MKDYWGADENDLIVDRATPPLIKMLGLCQDVLDQCGSSTDGRLSDALNIIDVEERIIDALAECRAYQKRRNEECATAEDKKGADDDAE